MSATGVKCMCTQRVKSGRCVKTVNAKNTQKSPIHENADANITCDFGDGDVSRYRSQFPHTRTHGQPRAHIVSSIIFRFIYCTTVYCTCIQTMSQTFICNNVTS